MRRGEKLLCIIPLRYTGLGLGGKTETRVMWQHNLAAHDVQNLIQRTNRAQQEGLTEPLIVAILFHL
jgi:hypothetical protein